MGIEQPSQKPRKPFKFPLGFEEFLRFLMPEKRPEDRMRIIRVWLSASLREERHLKRYGIMQPLTVTPKPTIDDVEAAIKDWRAKPFETAHAAMIAGFFGRWLEAYKGMNYRVRARKAAEARWKKKRRKRKKIL